MTELRRTASVGEGRGCSRDPPYLPLLAARNGPTPPGSRSLTSWNLARHNREPRGSNEGLVRSFRGTIDLSGRGHFGHTCVTGACGRPAGVGSLAPPASGARSTHG